MTVFDRRKPPGGGIVGHRSARCAGLLADVDARFVYRWGVLRSLDTARGGATRGPFVAMARLVANVPNRQGYGMGVQFLNLAPADEQRIAEFARAMRRQKSQESL